MRPAKEGARYRRRFTSVLVVLTIACVAALPIGRKAELSDIDRRFAIVPGGAPTGRVVLVTIDDASFREIGVRWPWPRTILAEAINTLSAYDVRAIGIDIALSEPGFSHTNDQVLAEAITTAPPVVVPSKFELQRTANYKTVSVIPPLTMFTDAGAVTGYVNLVEDADGRVRRIVLHQEHGGITHLHFALSLYAAGRREFLKRSGESGSYRIDTELLLAGVNPSYGRTLIIPFLGPAGSMPRISFHELLSGEVPREMLEDAYVIVGATFREAHDNAPTPFFSGTPMSGVEIHGQILDGLVAGRTIHASPTWINVLLLSIVSIAIAIVLQRVPPLWGALVTIGGIVVIWGIGVIAFQRGVLLAIVPSIVGPIIVFIGMIAFHYAVEARHSRYIRSVFSRYVAPDVVEQILEDPEAVRLGGELRDVTLFFSDIRGFTQLSETKKPEDIVLLLNEYFDAMTGVIFEYGGTVNKFIGDAIMAFWGAPLPMADAPDRAVAACIEMRRRLMELNQRWSDRREETLRIGMAVHTGSVLVGNIGSTRQMEYTVIGDAVNVCSRIESMTKEIGTDLLISDSVYRRLSSPPHVVSHHDIAIRGRNQTITLHAVKGA